MQPVVREIQNNQHQADLNERGVIVEMVSWQKQQEPTLSWSAEKIGSQCLLLLPPTLTIQMQCEQR